MKTEAGRRMEEEISQIPKFGAQASLENLNGYLELLGHPEKELKVIHVAGTNGKGSTCAFLECILREAGYKTALFTSPHLVSMTERFRINFIPCREEQLVSAWNTVKKLMESQRGSGPDPVENQSSPNSVGVQSGPKSVGVQSGPNSAGVQSGLVLVGNQSGPVPVEEHALAKRSCLAPLTYFEILFVMSLLIFTEEQPDYCIMETGLGGRLDATVLTNPVICAITSISLDHTAILGDTIGQIAAEKAGIIKEGIPVVALDEENGAFPVLEQEACRKHSKIFRVSSRDITISKKSKNGIDFSFQCSYYNDKRLKVGMFGDYQTLNAALSYVVARNLPDEIPEEAILKGLADARWEGRMEEILPNVFVDGAHNPGAVRQIVSMLAETLESEAWSLLFAVCADKDYTSMIHDLAGLPWKKIYVTRMEGTRGAAVSQIAKLYASQAACPVETGEKVSETFAKALADQKEGNLLCLGSLYLVGELKRLVECGIDN